MRYRSLLLALVLLSASLVGPAPAAAQLDGCFAETGFCIDGRLLDFWRTNGGLMVFGFPIAPARHEATADTRTAILTQWFERNRLELHSDKPQPYRVQLGRLGAGRVKRTAAAQPQDGCRWFAETQHNVCNQAPGSGFRSYWQTHGVEIDGKPGVSFVDSLALFGLPLTEAEPAVNSSGDTVVTQWFERARFEWHPRNPPANRVLLGRLGAEAIAMPHDGASGVAGVIQAGPTCPVERPGEDCPDRPLQATVRVVDAVGGRFVTEFTSGLDGRFHVPLAPGRYRLVPLTPNNAPLPRGVPMDVDVPAGRFVLIVIQYDTGIR